MTQEAETTKVTKLYIRSVKAKMRKFEVINFDPVTKDVTLRVPNSGIQFVYPKLTKARAEELGYELVKE